VIGKLFVGFVLVAIEAHSGILGGKPVIGGTRISVDLLLELVGAGLKVDDILREYPQLKREDVLMVLHVAKKAHEILAYDKLRSTAEALSPRRERSRIGNSTSQEEGV
jgi:uncharacterized protein (DUF433 family)